MKKTILLLTLFLFTSMTFGQKGQIFNEYSPTASSWDIVKWNLADTTGIVCVIKELVDENGRVTELQFLKNGRLIPDHLCYLANRVTFEYKDNQIIERYFFNDKEPVANECEMPYKSIYHLKNKYIEKVETFFKFDTINFTKDEVEEIEKYVPEYFLYQCNDSTNTEIDYYYHSFSKMNGIYPVNKNYKYESDNYYYGNKPENQSIIDGIEKLRKN